MINYEKVAEKIFAIIKGHGHTLAMFKDDGMETSDAAEARRFFVKEPNYMITLDEEGSKIKINKNSNLSLDDLESVLKQMKNLARANMLNTQVKVFGKEIAPKDFAYQAKKYRNKEMGEITEGYVEEEIWIVHIPANVFDGKYYDYRTVPYKVSLSDAPTKEDAIAYVNNNKEKVLAELEKKRMTSGSRSVPYVGPKRLGIEKNVKFKDTYYVNPTKVLRSRSVEEENTTIAEASLSRMHGSTKTSYQTLESVKMIVRHRKAVDEEVRGSRSRQISAIFLEQAGERFRFPHNNLQGARAMARHMFEGGNMQDTVGEYIVEAVGNLIKLNEFVRYARTNKLINEANEDIVKIVKENIATLRGELGGLTGANSYAKVSEAIAAREADVLEETDTNDLQDMFTVRKFDEKITDTLPLVRKLMDNKQAWRDAILEASSQTVLLDAKEPLAEDDILEFDSPVQKMGYKVQKIATRMIESGDLKAFVNKVAGKLIEGTKISEFEKTVVRNVMENATIQEDSTCKHCDGEEPCGWCDQNDNDGNTFESILEGYELKIKMLEHEEIFEATSDGLSKQDANMKAHRAVFRAADKEWDEMLPCDKCGEKGVGCSDEQCFSDLDEDAKKTQCSKCNGTGRAPGPPRDGKMFTQISCKVCSGYGYGLHGDPARSLRKAKVSEEPGDSDHGYNYEGPQDDPEDYMDSCPDCGGSGKAIDSSVDDDCLFCDGEGYV